MFFFFFAKKNRNFDKKKLESTRLRIHFVPLSLFLRCRLWRLWRHTFRIENKSCYSTSSFAKKKYPVDFDVELKIGDVRYDNMTKITIKIQLFWHLRYEMQLCSKMNRFWVIGNSKRVLFPEKSVFILLLSYFCTLFSKNGLFATWPPFLNRWLLRNGSFLRKVTFHMVNVKRVVL